MPISSMQQPRQMYGLGSFVKKAVKGVTGAVKGIVKSDLGKAALLGVGLYGLPGGFGGITGILRPDSALRFGGLDSFLKKEGVKKIGGVLRDVAVGTGIAGVTDYLTKPDDPEARIGGRSKDEIENVISGMKQNYRNLGYEEGEIDLLIEDYVQQNYPGYGNYANGGRIGYGNGTQYTFEQFLEDKQKVDQAMTMEELRREYERQMELKKIRDQRNLAAYGGRMGYAFGNPEQNAINAAGIMNLPLNQNPAGVTELDLRETGGFIPPVGVKEKADDIPAMLSNNEFVMTADAVKQFGDGDVNKGAQRMYAMMKKLENGGRV